MFVSTTDVLNFVKENDVKFIRLSFCDLRGNMKNIAIMAEELPFAIENGIPFDAVCFEKSNDERYLLVPDLSTMSVLPWRPKTGSVIRFFCNIYKSDGSFYEADLRKKLKDCVDEIKQTGLKCEIGTKCEFYLFKNNEYGRPEKTPVDNGGYLDVAPLDQCENIRREICLSLEEMGINPQSSCHKRGPGQNEIDFICSDPLTAADNMMQYKNVVKAIASQSGLYASFMPKPLKNKDGSAFNISFHVSRDKTSIFGSSDEKISEEGEHFMAGVLHYIKEITAFLNPITNSYKRLGTFMAPKYADWSDNRTNPALRLSRTMNDNSHLVLRTADASCNPYIAILLLLKAGMKGIENKMQIQAQETKVSLPQSLEEAVGYAKSSELVKETFSQNLLNEIFEHFDNMIEEYRKAEDKDIFEDGKFFYVI
ncbi:MAG: glutamine synthetase family protein [Oscillospiraceae bacterium]|nr:glutamine synthetase family protein [Oscillospiraceae bacterium]